jgi:HEAT repeat protein
MLPIRFACFGMACRLLGLILLLGLGAMMLAPAAAGPLEPVGVEEFRAMIDPKRDPNPEPSEAGRALASYRQKMRRSAKELPSLGEVARVLLLSEWAAAEFDTENGVSLDQVKKAVLEPTDDAFKNDVQQMMAKTDDPSGVNRSIVSEIKREVRLQLMERLEKRTRFYLLEGRTEDRIAAANLIRDTMTNSRRQDISMYRDPSSGAAVPGVLITTSKDVNPSSRYFRQRMRDLSGDVTKLTENPNPQVRAAGIHALSDLENDPAVLVKIYKPLLTSPDSDVVTRRATAEALGHTLEVNTMQMDKSRPQPYLTGLRLILPVAALGLTDNDAGVRRASLEACARAAVIFDDLASDPLVLDRRVVFRPAQAVMEEILPKLNAAARDPVPEFRVAACKVLEGLVLGFQKLQRYGRVEPLPAPGIDPTAPPAPPSSDKERSRKKVSLPVQRSGRGRVSPGPSQWATGRPRQGISPPLMPPVPLPGEKAESVVTLERPTRISATSVHETSLRPAAPVVQTVMFRAPQQPDELPPPAVVKSGISGTVSILIENLKDRDYRVRLAAADALESLGEAAVPAIPALVEALRDTNKFVRWSSARTLGQLNPRQEDIVVPGLMRLLDDREDRSVRIAAAKALEQYGEHAKAAVSLLAHVVNRGDKEYIIAILRTIQGVGTDAAPALANVAWVLSDTSQPPSVRIEAAQTLGRFGPLAKGQLPTLRDVMNNDSDEDVRNAASTAVLAVDRPEK